jgi:nitrogen fixation NifU-like protein
MILRQVSGLSNSEQYRRRILDHDMNPRNKRWIEEADFESHGSNPVCGDDVLIQVRLRDEKIEEIVFSGRGCAISQAAASILTELARGKSLEWAERSSEEDMFRLLGLGEHRKVRVSCELLGIRALKNGIFKYGSSKSRH